MTSWSPSFDELWQILLQPPTGCRFSNKPTAEGQELPAQGMYTSKADQDDNRSQPQEKALSLNIFEQRWLTIHPIMQMIAAKRTTDRIVNVQDAYTFNVQVHNPGTAWKEGPVVVVRLEGWLSPGYLCQCTVQCWDRPPFSLDVRSVASVGM